MSLLNRYTDQNPYAFNPDPSDPGMWGTQNGLNMPGEVPPAQMPGQPRGNLGKIIAGGLSAMGGLMGGVAPPLNPATMGNRGAAPPGTPATPGTPTAPSMRSNMDPFRPVGPGQPMFNPHNPGGPMPGTMPNLPGTPPPAPALNIPLDQRSPITPMPGGLPPTAPVAMADPMLMRQQAMNPYSIYS